MQSIDFTFRLCAYKEVFCLTNTLSLDLQKEKQDFATFGHQSKTLIRDLERQKTNLKFDIGLTEAAELLEWEGEIEFELEQLKVDSRKPKITKESLKSEFYSIIDKLIEELKLRFGDEQLLIYKAFFELLDIKDDVSDDKFESTFELFKIEAEILSLLIEKDKYPTLLSIYMKASVVPVSSAGVERAFIVV
jgi:hypothetical protein